MHTHHLRVLVASCFRCVCSNHVVFSSCWLHVCLLSHPPQIPSSFCVAVWLVEEVRSASPLPGLCRGVEGGVGHLGSVPSLSQAVSQAETYRCRPPAHIIGTRKQGT